MVVLTDRMMSNAHKLKHMRFHLNMRKNFFTVRVAEHWNRESPLLETFKTHLGTFLSPAQDDPALAGGLD